MPHPTDKKLSGGMSFDDSIANAEAAKSKLLSTVHGSRRGHCRTEPVLIGELDLCT